METVSQNPSAQAAAIGYDALRSSAAWLDLSARGKILATGEDRARLLHAMTTNQVQELKPGQGCYTFFLSAQGRIQGDGNLFCRAEDILLDVEPETRQSLREHLDKFIIADDVTLVDATDRTFTLDLEGPLALAQAGRLGIPVPEKPWSHTGWQQVMVARVSFTGAPGLRFFGPVEEKPRLIEQLHSAGATEAAPDAVRIVRLEHFTPRYGDDIFATTLTQETQQLHAVSFNKGCYIGQEVVERVRSRGLVHRLLVGVEIESSEVPQPEARLYRGEENVGKVTSAAFSPALGKVVSLAYVRRELAEPGTLLTVNGAPAGVRAVYCPAV
ncbi:MAG TPA: glycine cleavage T C-terminal barrel domain-containing protein [Bryobacteraceae bacterium]|nr:glycine cleavage T C-terminal barrel domain-containing protein [Bryobacteraceae bacterium]